MKKILVIQTAFIGDVILATPVIETLHTNFPNCNIDFLLKKGNEVLVKEHPFLRKIYTLDKSKKYTSLVENIREIRKEKYDLILNLQRFTTSGLIAGLSGAKKIVGFKKNPMSWLFSQRIAHDMENGQHEVDRNLQLLQSICPVVVRKPKLYPSAAHLANILTFTRTPFICLAPASVWKTKQAPEEIWLKVILSAPKETPIYLVGGEVDYDLCENIRLKSLSAHVLNLCGKLTLMETAALFSFAHRVYVNDSGPLHIASAMNTPVSVFFCSTIPDFGFGPLSDDSMIIEVKNLPCRPCGLHGKTNCPEGHFKCGTDLIIAS
jgi:lipopolysaccharide heptosyltransferase II